MIDVRHPKPVPGDVDLRRPPIDAAVVSAAEVAVWALVSERPGHRWAVLDRGGHAIACSDGDLEAWASVGGPVADLQLEGDGGWLSIVSATGVVDDADRLAAHAVARMLHAVIITDAQRRRAEDDAREAWTVANVDGVTNVLNARGLWDRVSRIPWSSPTAADVCVVRIAVDDLKGLNQRHGHLLGDQVLRTLADRLTAAVGAGDVIARLGGGEFVVMVHDVEPEPLRARLTGAVDDVGVVVHLGVAQHDVGEPIRTTVARADLDLRRSRSVEPS